MVFGEAIAAGRMAPRETERPGMETRDIAALLIGLEAGLAFGLLAFGTTLLAPMAIGLLGAAVGYAVRRGRLQLIRRALRDQMRAAR
jgi:fatty acid desaturase